MAKEITEQMPRITIRAIKMPFQLRGSTVETVNSLMKIMIMIFV